VDLGGGTGENVSLMSSYIDLSRFRHIYIVDLCKSLCEQVGGGAARHGSRGSSAAHGCPSTRPGTSALSRPAAYPSPPSLPLSCAPPNPQARKKVAEHGWTNVSVIEADACQFAPPEGAATLVTFSYSLSSETFGGGGFICLCWIRRLCIEGALVGQGWEWWQRGG
jgi:hypothetical protein